MASNETPPWRWSSSATRAGVANTPMKFDKDALQIAAATLPPAIDVKAIDD